MSTGRIYVVFLRLWVHLCACNYLWIWENEHVRAEIAAAEHGEKTMTINIPEGLRRDALLNGRTELYSRLGKLARYGGRGADVDERLADLYTAIAEVDKRLGMITVQLPSTRTKRGRLVKWSMTIPAPEA